MPKHTIILERRFVSAGAILINEGDEANCAYLIQSGAVSVFTKTGEGQEVELARLGIGEICGEMALFNQKRRTASVRVVEDANLIIISKQVLQEKLEKTDPTIRAVMDMLIKRLGAGNMLVTHSNKKQPNVQDMIDTNFKFFKQINDKPEFAEYLNNLLFDRYSERKSGSNG